LCRRKHGFKSPMTCKRCGAHGLGWIKHRVQPTNLSLLPGWGSVHPCTVLSVAKNQAASMKKQTLAVQFTSDAESDITVFIDVDNVDGSGPITGLLGLGSSSCLVVTRARAVVTEISSSISWSKGKCVEHTFSFSENFEAASPLSGGKLFVAFEQGNPLPTSLQWQSVPDSNKKSQYECRFIEVSLDIFRLVGLPNGIEILLTSPPKSLGASR